MEKVLFRSRQWLLSMYPLIELGNSGCSSPSTIHPVRLLTQDGEKQRIVFVLVVMTNSDMPTDISIGWYIMTGAGR